MVALINEFYILFRALKILFIQVNVKNGKMKNRCFEHPCLIRVFIYYDVYIKTVFSDNLV